MMRELFISFGYVNNLHTLKFKQFKFYKIIKNIIKIIISNLNYEYITRT